MNLKMAFAITTLIAAGTIHANAAPIFDTALSAPGVYYGSGNSNSHFTVDKTGNIETGLSAIERFIGPYTPIGSTYFVPTGPTTVPGKTGTDWGFVFSVNLNAAGTGTLKLSDVAATLSMQDIGKGTSGSFNPMLIPDNSEFGAGGKCVPSILCNPAQNYAFQNSEALSFAAIAGALGDPLFDLNADDTYVFTLSTSNSSGLLSSDRMTVVAGKGAQNVPEPITLSLFSVGALGMAAMRRRQKRA